MQKDALIMENSLLLQRVSLACWGNVYDTEVYLDGEFEQRVMLYTQGSLSKEYVSSHMCGVGDLL